MKIGDVLTNKFIISWLSLILSVYLTNILFNILLMLHVFNLTMYLTKSIEKIFWKDSTGGPH